MDDHKYRQLVADSEQVERQQINRKPTDLEAVMTAILHSTVRDVLEQLAAKYEAEPANYYHYTGRQIAHSIRHVKDSIPPA